MFLSRLIIKNYRSIKDLDLRLTNGKNVIVGRNNSGKSNIARAIDLVLGESSPDYFKTENITEDEFFTNTLTEASGQKVIEKAQELVIFCQLTRNSDEEFDYSEINKCRGYYKLVNNKSWKAGTYDEVRLPLTTCSEEEIEELFKYDIDNEELGVFEKSKQAVWIDSKVKNQVKFQNELEGIYQFGFCFRASHEENGRIRKELRMLYRESDQVDWNLCFSAPLRNALLQSAIIPSFRDPANQLRISNWGWYGKLLKATIDPSDARLQTAFNELRQASEQVFGTLQEKMNSSSVKIAFPDTQIKLQFNPDSKQDVHKNALIYVDDGFNSLLQNKGSGIQSAVVIGLFHFYVTEIAHLGSSLLLVEEPELYLHPHARRFISSRLDEFLDAGRNQVILTTHSEEFISSNDKNLNIVLVSRDPQLGTIGRNAIFETPTDKRLLVKKQNSEMFFSDCTILVEGGDKYIVEALGREFSRKNPELKLPLNWLDANNISIINTCGKEEFAKYVIKLNELCIPWFIFGDFDFLVRCLSEFLSQTKTNKDLLDLLNGLKSKFKNVQKIKKITEVDSSLHTNVQDFLAKLKTRNIFLLEGELEDQYLTKGHEYIRGLSKEVAAIHLGSELLASDKNASEYVDTKSYFELFAALNSRLAAQRTARRDTAKATGRTPPSEQKTSQSNINATILFADDDLPF